MYVGVCVCEEEEEEEEGEDMAYKLCIYIKDDWQVTLH